MQRILPLSLSVLPLTGLVEVWGSDAEEVKTCEIFKLNGIRRWGGGTITTRSSALRGCTSVLRTVVSNVLNEGSASILPTLACLDYVNLYRRRQ